MGKQPWYSKTIITFAVTTLVGVAALAGYEVGLDTQAAIIDVILSIAGIALRFATKEPIAKA